MSNFVNNIYDETTLNKMGIHDLRSYARKYGVKAPTMLKKDEIIAELLKIKEGQITPTKSNMGRKPIESKTYNYNDFDLSFSPLCFNEPVSDYDTPNFVTSGQLSFNDNADPIISITEDSGRTYNIQLQEKLFLKYGLKKDDVLTLELKYVQNSPFKYNVEKIIDINGIETEKYNRDSFAGLPDEMNMEDAFDYDPKFKQLFNNNKLIKGQSQFYYYNDRNVENVCIELAENLSNSETYCVVLNSSPLKVRKSNHDNVIIHSLSIDKSFEEQNREIIVVQEKVRNLLTEGKQVVFIINELEEIFRTINYHISKSVSDTISPEAITAIRKLFLSSKYINEKQNLTVVCISSLSNSGNYRNALIGDVIKYTYYYTLPQDNNF